MMSDGIKILRVSFLPALVRYLHGFLPSGYRITVNASSHLSLIWTIEGREVMQMGPQNALLCHMNYFELKTLKTQETQELFSASLTPERI